MAERTDHLRYLEARSVRCPAGELAGFRVCSADAQPLGTVAGILISPAARRLEYLVLRAPGLLMQRRYLLPFEAGTVVQDEARVLRVPVRKDELRLEAFPRSVQRFDDEDLLNVLFSQDAA